MVGTFFCSIHISKNMKLGMGRSYFGFKNWYDKNGKWQLLAYLLQVMKNSVRT